ncbi:hypothetical protein M758_3G219300 [Ceratodon purpureus]|nr:hypothetical protein M758_3G219300 [Ceratodon purpureus]
MMELEDASNDHNLKPQQSDDEDSDFPEFEFPVGDCVDVDGGRLTVRGEESAQVENGDGTVARVPVRAHIEDSPKKMPPAIRNSGPEHMDSSRLKVQEEPSQPEVSKHVVAEESKIPTPQVSLPSQRKVLQSNPSFKSLVTILGEPLKFRSPRDTEPKNIEPSNGDAGDGGESNTTESGIKAPSTPTSKRLNGILSRVNAKVAAAAAAQAQADPSRTPDRAARPATSTLSVNALVEKFSTGVRTRTEGARRESLSSPRNLTSPRRTLADRSRSPVLSRHLQESQPTQAPTTPRTLSSPRRSQTLPSSTTDRSVSPVPRSWKDSVYGDLPKDRRPNLSKPDATPPPRFLTPTRAAALKAVKPPATPSNGNSNSKSLQFTTAFGITTPVKPVSDHTPRKSTVFKDTPARVDHGQGNGHANGHSNGHANGHAHAHNHGHVHAKPTPTVTEPTGFNFRTDERAERRKDFYSKLEERMKAKEMERKRAEAKAQEEKENQLRELRKSLTYKANPVPRFYQEPAPAAPEIRKIAPTRAKSPNFTAPRRRDSCPGSSVSESHSSSRTSPLRSRTLLRCASLESNSGHSSSGYKPSLPKPKLPFRPV